MNDQKPNDNFLVVGDKYGETIDSPSKTIIYRNVNDLDTDLSGLHSFLNHGNSDFVECLDFQRSTIEQGNIIQSLKLSDYEKASAERDNNIKSMHTSVMNSGSKNCVVTNHYNNFMEKSKSINDTFTCFNTSFTNICESFSKLGDTVGISGTSQKDVTNLIKQTTNTLQKQIFNMPDTIDGTLKKENIRAEQEMEILNNNYYLDLLAYNNNSDACGKKMEILKYENNILCEKCNEGNMKLNEEKETILNFNQHYEKFLKKMESQNVLLNENESINVKYDKTVFENKDFKDEFTTMKMDENKKQMDIQLNTIKEQTELLDDLKIYKELNDTLKKENSTLKKENEHLKKINTALVDDISNKLSQNEIQEEKEIKHKVLCKNYNDFLKMQEDMLQDISKKFKLQKVRENDLQNEIIDLKQQVEMSNAQMTNLQDEVQTNCILIPELQSKIDMKYKTEAKQLYKQVTRLRYHYSIPEQKKPVHPPTLETIEISDEDINVDEDASVVQLNNQGMPNMKVSVQPNSNKINLIYNSSYKRHFLSLKHDGNSEVKKRRVFFDIASDQKTPSSATIVKYNNDSQQIDSSMSSSFRSINLKHEDKNCTINKMELR